MGMRVALPGVSAGTSRVCTRRSTRYRETSSRRGCHSRQPPRLDVVAHLSVLRKITVANGRQGRPQPNVGNAGVCCQLAMVKDVGAVLLCVFLALRREKAAGMRSAADLAMIEERLGVAEDEIDIALDIAVGEVLARRRVLAVGICGWLRRSVVLDSPTGRMLLKMARSPVTARTASACEPCDTCS